MKSAHLWSAAAGVAGALLAPPTLRADPAGGAQVVPAAYWISGDAYGSALNRGIPDSQEYAHPRPVDPAAAKQPRSDRPQPDAEATFDSPVFAARPLGWPETAAPTVPRLPAFNVTDFRIVAIQPPELYTRQGMIYQSFRNHPGLVYGNFFHSNENQAQEMYREEHWNETKADFWQTAFAMAVGGDLAEGRLIKQEVYDEDLQMRAEADSGNSVPENGQMQFGNQNGDSKVLEIIPVFPVNFPLVRVKW